MAIHPHIIHIGMAHFFQKPFSLYWSGANAQFKISNLFILFLLFG